MKDRKTRNRSRLNVLVLSISRLLPYCLSLISHLIVYLSSQILLSTSHLPSLCLSPISHLTDHLPCPILPSISHLLSYCLPPVSHLIVHLSSPILSSISYLDYTEWDLTTVQCVLLDFVPQCHLFVSGDLGFWRPAHYAALNKKKIQRFGIHIKRTRPLHRHLSWQLSSRQAP